MEAIIFLSSVTFVIAIGSAIVQGVTFWRRYRVRLHVTNKASLPSVDLEAVDPPMLPPPPRLYHSRLGSRSSRVYPERHFGTSRPVSDYRWGPYRIVEEPESVTVAHHPPPLHSSLPAHFLPTAPASMPEATPPHD